MKPAVPILRIFDEAKARDFYLEFLGFTVDWEHRFEADFPVYMQVSQASCVLHLSEHHGDACPGASLRIETPNLEEFCASLRSKNYKYSRPGNPEKQAWGTMEISIGDPFGNKLTFFETVRANSIADG